MRAIAVLAIAGCNSLVGVGDYPSLLDAPRPICADLYDNLYADHRYKIYGNAETYDRARMQCELDGAHLLKIEAADEKALAKVIIGSRGDSWIGLDDLAEEGRFAWYDGTPATFTDWKSNEPNGSTDENCVVDNGNDPGWNDTKCGDTRPYICECEQSTPVN